MSQANRDADAVVVGGGIFGLYAARTLLAGGRSVVLLEAESDVFSRASSINQARLHLGYHYPRSLGTALTSAYFFQKFIRDFEEAIVRNFTHVYAISNRNSYTTASQFEAFCERLGIPLEPLRAERFFRPGTVEACYETTEFAFDATALKKHFLAKMASFPGFSLRLNERITSASQQATHYVLETTSGAVLRTPLVVNCSYASLNSVLDLFGVSPMKLRYELTEIALGMVSPEYRSLGFTVMDGPFFSVMPFGASAYHSLSAVEYTPHEACEGGSAVFSCQKRNRECTPKSLRHCDACSARPASAHLFMEQLTKKYMKEDFSFDWKESKFTVKTILKNSVVDDSRPTEIQVFGDQPKLVSVLSGKINTLYELDAVLK